MAPPTAREDARSAARRRRRGRLPDEAREREYASATCRFWSVRRQRLADVHSPHGVLAARPVPPRGRGDAAAACSRRWPGSSAFAAVRRRRRGGPAPCRRPTSCRRAAAALYPANASGDATKLLRRRRAAAKLLEAPRAYLQLFFAPSSSSARSPGLPGRGRRSCTPAWLTPTAAPPTSRATTASRCHACHHRAATSAVLDAAQGEGDGCWCGAPSGRRRDVLHLRLIDTARAAAQGADGCLPTLRYQGTVGWSREYCARSAPTCGTSSREYRETRGGLVSIAAKPIVSSDPTRGLHRVGDLAEEPLLRCRSRA